MTALTDYAYYQSCIKLQNMFLLKALALIIEISAHQLFSLLKNVLVVRWSKILIHLLTRCASDTADGQPACIGISVLRRGINVSHIFLFNGMPPSLPGIRGTLVPSAVCTVYGNPRAAMVERVRPAVFVLVPQLVTGLKGVV